jgi:hypothetical protein
MLRQIIDRLAKPRITLHPLIEGLTNVPGEPIPVCFSLPVGPDQTAASFERIFKARELSEHPDSQSIERRLVRKWPHAGVGVRMSELFVCLRGFHNASFATMGGREREAAA